MANPEQGSKHAPAETGTGGGGVVQAVTGALYGVIDEGFATPMAKLSLDLTQEVGKLAQVATDPVAKSAGGGGSSTATKHAK